MNEEEKQQGLTEKRKAALLRYMAILFAMAFLLVLVSLVMQMHNSQTTISELNATQSNALSNAEYLQEQNRALQEEKQALEEEKSDLLAKLETLEQALDEAEKETDQKSEQALIDAQKEASDFKKAAVRTEQAYEALLAAMGCEIREGNVTYAKAMETLKEYKDYLSEQGLAEYEALLKNE